MAQTITFWSLSSFIPCEDITENNPGQYCTFIYQPAHTVPRNLTIQIMLETPVNMKYFNLD